MSLCFIVVSMQNSDNVLEEFHALLHFLNAQCCHNFHFKVSRSPVRHLAASDVAESYITEILLNVTLSNQEL